MNGVELEVLVGVKGSAGSLAVSSSSSTIASGKSARRTFSNSGSVASVRPARGFASCVSAWLILPAAEWSSDECTTWLDIIGPDMTVYNHPKSPFPLYIHLGFLFLLYSKPNEASRRDSGVDGIGKTGRVQPDG